MARLVRSLGRLSRIAYGSSIDDKANDNMPLGKLLLAGEGALILNEVLETLSDKKKRFGVANIAIYFAASYIGYQLYKQYKEKRVKTGNSIENLVQGIDRYNTKDKRKEVLDKYAQGLSRMRKENTKNYYRYLSNLRNIFGKI
ncbi:MAG: hypothetical protein AABW41_01075 [Nanoarchaeota archaeon]